MAEKNDEVKSYCEKPLDSYREHDLPENVGIVESDTRKERERFNNESNNRECVKPPSPTVDDTNGWSCQDYKIINDPIHGHIQLDSILMSIIDTPQFQRLRDVKQLGCTYRVFPGASHNRFEHAIGVCYLAGEIVEKMQQYVEEITKADILCVKIAGLCYNLGYGPFSHVFNQMCTKTFPRWNVESAAVVMLRHLIKENDLDEPLEDNGINEEERNFIYSLINHRNPVPDEKKKIAFLRKVVNDPDSGIDAVTMDSIARDSYLLNLPCNFDHKRLVKFVRVKEEKGEHVICYRDKEAPDLYSMLLSRVSLQARAYQHKTVQLIEWMLEQALTEADEVMGFTKIARELLCGDKVRENEAAKKFTRLTDYVTDQILDRAESDDQLEKSKKLLLKIQKRKLMKLIGTVQMDEKDMEPEVLERFKQEAKGRATLKDCVMLTVEFRFGTKNCENPVEKMFFYSKIDTNLPFHIKRDQVSRILPERFTDFVLRVYHERASATKYTAVEEEFRDLVRHKRGLSWIKGFSPYAFPTTTSPTAAEGNSAEQSTEGSLAEQPCKLD